MRIIIAGGRDFRPTEEDWKVLDHLNANGRINVVLCGEARGADTFGRRWAEARGIPVASYPADWDRFGKSAGYRRNVEMATAADGLVAFPGGRGTAHMIDIARDHGLATRIISRR